MVVDDPIFWRVGAMNNVALAAAALAVIVFAVWARQTDFLGWQSGTNIVLAAVLLVLAVLRWVIGVAPLVSFWIICSSASRSPLRRCGRSCIGETWRGLLHRKMAYEPDALFPPWRERTWPPF
jgi:hypothetical protein